MGQSGQRVREREGGEEKQEINKYARQVETVEATGGRGEANYYLCRIYQEDGRET